MFKTMDQLRKDQDAEKKNRKRGVESYTGGEKSGMAIEDAPDANEILKQAHENSVKNPPKEGEEPEKDDTNCKITMWKNGFEINGEDFRSYKEEANKKFLQELKEGYVPVELRGKFKDGLRVAVEDRSHVDYVPPPPGPFHGQGTTMSGATKTEDLVVNHDMPKPVADPGKPTGNLGITYHTGEKEMLKVNHDMMFDLVLSYVGMKAPVGEMGRFELLVAGVPPRKIEDGPGKTLAQLKLINTRVIQKIL